MTMKSGIYIIRNIQNDQCYIGSAIHLQSRWRTHRYHLRHGKHHSIYLQRAFIKYGEDAFEFLVVERCNDPAKLLEIEQWYIDHLHPVYNVAQIAGNRLGMKHRPETLAKLSEQAKGRTHNRGRKHTAESRHHMSLAHKGQRQTEHARELSRKRMIGNTYGVGNKNHLGKPHSKESKAKMSEAHRQWWAKKKDQTNE